MSENTSQSILSGESFYKAYHKNNYLVEYEKNKYSDNQTCAIYFSSSGIYYPNTLEEFEKAFFENDRYEWYKTRFRHVSKHIFVRDVAKQFYITGINEQVDSIDKLLDLLKIETKGFSVITMGSSAGGYAAIAAGIALHADFIFSFSGYLNLETLDRSTWPYIYEYQDEYDKKKWYDLRGLLNTYEGDMFYFYSELNEGECMKRNLFQELKNDLWLIAMDVIAVNFSYILALMQMGKRSQTNPNSMIG